MKSIKQIEQELNWVRNTRFNIEMLLQNVASVNVLIGGSYALKYQCDSFEKREVTDYDFIIRVSKKESFKVYNFFRAMVSLGIMEHGYSGNDAYKFNHVCLNGKYAECIVVPVEDDCSPHSVRVYGRTWEKAVNIIKAKKEYIDSYKKKGLEPRKKDVEDVENYYANEDLPF